jgi:hypothetical protein
MCYVDRTTNWTLPIKRRLKKKESPNCEQCEGNQAETVEHFLIICEGFWEARRRLRSKVGERHMRVEMLLGNVDIVEATLEYIVETRRFMIE